MPFFSILFVPYYNWVVMTVFRTGTFGLLLVVTTSDDTSHGDTIAASTASIFGVPLLFWSFSCSFCETIYLIRIERNEKTENILTTELKEKENENIFTFATYFFHQGNRTKFTHMYIRTVYRQKRKKNIHKNFNGNKCVSMKPNKIYRHIETNL